MHIKSVDIKGFKSFSKKIRVNLEPGLLVLVGPNGSGKSNIVDAILWAMGEQSAKLLRGNNMDDVIFTGNGRSTVDAAEVIITLDNSDKNISMDYSEISIGRRLFRSGESQYMVNGSSCRLNDLREILAEAALGKGLYSVISQGRIDEVLSGRPEDRRAMVDEAAGILKHRLRKDKVLRNLKNIDEKIIRARDIHKEIKRQLSPLLKQAESAKKHEALLTELKNTEIRLNVGHLNQIKNQWQDLKKQMDLIDAARIKKENDLRNLEMKKIEAEKKISDTSVERRKSSLIMEKLVRVQEKCHGQVLLLSEKKNNVEKKIDDIQRSLELYEINKKQMDSSGENANLKEKLVVQIQNISTNLAGMEKERQKISKTSETFIESRNKLNYELDRQKYLKSLVEEKYKTINNDLIKQTIAGHQKRLEALNNSTVTCKNDLDSISQNIINIEESKKNLENEIIALEKNLKDHHQEIKSLEEKLANLREELAKIQGRLDLFKLLFPERENKNDENTFYLITIYPDGIVKRGQPADFANPDSFRDEESKILKEISKIESNIKNRQDEEEKLNHQHEELNNDLSLARDELNENIINKNRLVESLKSIEIESPKESELLRAAQRRLLEDEKKAEQYSKEIISIDGKIKGIENEAYLKDKEIQELSEKKKRIQVEFSHLSGEKSDLTEKLLQIKLRDNFPRVEVDELTANLTELKEREQYYAELSARIQLIKGFSDSGIEQIKQTQKKTSAEEKFKRDDILITGQQILEFERNCAKLREDHYRLDIKQSEFKIKTEIITKNIIEDLETPLETAIALRGEDDDIEDLEMKKNQLRSKLGKIGPVNLIAAEELSELTQRNDFFENQLSDLTESKRSLIKLVLELDQLIIERFKGIYEAVSQNFSDLSDLFFPGGKGKLILTDENNLLDSGIDIAINPKGKNVRSLNLLSGGERSMSALAFIFSLFLSRITPFCIMDEVDAALDDFNLTKFVDILRKISEKSQLLAITHQKKTMETADIIYGVSIDADGSSSIISQKAEVFADA